MNVRGALHLTLGLLAAAALPAMGQSAVSFSLSPTGATAVPSGAQVTLDVVATFDTRLSAAAFTLGSTGSSNALLVGRSANPTGPNGLSYVSVLSQDPFNSGLPVSLSTSPQTEVLFDNDFGGAPGSAADGLPPGNNVLLETLTLRLNGTGTATISLSDVSAAHTTGPPSGSLFDSAGIGVPEVMYTVTAACGDANDDGAVNLLDWGILQACFTGEDVVNTDPDCEDLLCDEDDDIDLDDYSAFRLIAVGA